jgi:hypothetical protein
LWNANRDPRKHLFDDDIKSPERIQAIVDHAPEAENYCTDGWFGYVDLAYPGRHVRNCRNKSDMFTVEGVKAD